MQLLDLTSRRTGNRSFEQFPPAHNKYVRNNVSRTRVSLCLEPICEHLRNIASFTGSILLSGKRNPGCFFPTIFSKPLDPGPQGDTA